MNIPADVAMWIIGGLVVGLWFLLMWRLTSMERSRNELREGIGKFFDRFDAHTKDDATAFTSLRETMHQNHVELLGLLGNRRNDKN